MLLQAPLVVAGRYFRGTRRGNFIMWLSLFLGQPLLEVTDLSICPAMNLQ